MTTPRHFLSTEDWSRQSLQGLLDQAEQLRREPLNQHLAGQAVALLFLNPSLRTRTSFEVGAWQLGAKAVVLEPGNHDMPYYNPWERFTDPFRRFRRLDDAVGGVLVSPDVVLVSLLTTVSAQWRFPWSDGVVKPPALAQTVAALERLRGDPRHKIVIGHHPLLGPEDGRANPTIGGDEAFAALAAAGAHVMLSGHIHVPLDEVRMRKGHAMRMIGAGTLSTRLRHGAPPSYRIITCERGHPITSELRVLV